MSAKVLLLATMWGPTMFLAVLEVLELLVRIPRP